MLDTQTNLVFVPVRSRFTNNVNQIKDYYSKHRDCTTLDRLIQREIDEGKSNVAKISASRGVMWFTRAVQFLVEAFDNSLSKEDEELTVSFQHAYDASLGKHHDYIVGNLFAAALQMCPYREKFYRQLAGDDTIEQTMKDARIYFDNMRRVKHRLVEFCRWQRWDVSFKDESNDI